jgi:signal transduction histidine kinase
VRLPGYARVVIAQLRAGGQVVGILSCYFRTNADLTINSISLASAFGEQLGVIISNYHLQQQAKRLAVLDERQRLARELHDAVTQSLYSQTLFARSAIDALEDGRVDKTVEHLHQLEVTASQALREMRVLLHQLRPSDLAGMGLADAVEARLALVERRIGIKAYSNIDDVSDLGETTEDDLYRVILEGLNNALRHAEATEVNVRLEREGERLSLFIIDNGRGFDPDDTGLGMGLTNIRERARQLHGELQIDSKPGRGTALLITIPLAPREQPRLDGVAGGRAE